MPTARRTFMPALPEVGYLLSTDERPPRFQAAVRARSPWHHLSTGRDLLLTGVDARGCRGPGSRGHHESREDGRVYAGTHGGQAAFFAVDAETGEEIWRNEDAYTFAPPAHGPERIYINTSSKVMVLSKESGGHLIAYEPYQTP